MLKIKTLLFFLFLLCCNCTVAQKFTTVPDSLKKYNYLELADKVVVNAFNDASINKKNYIYAYSDLLKAKRENNSEEIFYGYLLMSDAIPDFTLALQYSDSACSLSRNKMPNLVSRAYFDRGNLYYTKNRLKDALDCFVIASRDSINPSKNVQNRIKCAIGMIKNTQGDYQEAVTIYEKCEETARLNQLPNYLVYLFGLAETYNRTNNITLSEQCANKGIALRTKDENGETYYPYFIGTQGKNEYKRKQYDKAIAYLMSSIQTFKKSDDHSNYAENSFFIGECYREQHLDEKAITYYKKVDSVFTAKNDIYAIDIPAYEHLIAYYKKKQDYQQVIYYSDQFIKADKVLNDNYKYIASKIAKTYDIQKVMAGKQASIKLLEKNSKKGIITIALLILGILLLANWFYRHNKNKQKEFEIQKVLFDAYRNEREQIPQIVTLPDLEKEDAKKRDLNIIDDKVVVYILECLDKFEKEEEYLKSNSLVTLAKEFNTNSTYLSRVINDEKGYTFTQYTNALRINYIIKKLETEKIYLEYKILTLSQFAGFNSVETFAKAFKDQTKMNPSDFIKQLTMIGLDKK
jgi:AraC-like DNA-binding protein